LENEKKGRMTEGGEKSITPFWALPVGTRWNLKEYTAGGNRRTLLDRFSYEVGNAGRCFDRRDAANRLREETGEPERKSVGKVPSETRYLGGKLFASRGLKRGTASLAIKCIRCKTKRGRQIVRKENRRARRGKGTARNETMSNGAPGDKRPGDSTL